MTYPTDPKYKFIKSPIDDSKNDSIETMEGDFRVVFLMEDGNRHYEEYKEWAKTNTAEAAD
tara:strand:+ start:1301 stop:1483 length:183 start_codon:yes stop_codon:yes gene_type:complete